jgi:hypothetical protein
LLPVALYLSLTLKVCVRSVLLIRNDGRGVLGFCSRSSGALCVVHVVISGSVCWIKRLAA